MQVGIIGAGAVGGAIAAMLARAGHSVEVTARGAHLAAIREGGVRLEGAWGDYTAWVDAHETLTTTAEVIIVTTKAQDAAAAIEANLAVIDGAPVLVVQNGLDGLGIAEAAATGSDVVGGLAMFAASYLSPGVVTITAPGMTFIGGTREDHDVPARYIANLLREVMPVHVVQNFAGAQWTKLVVNQINAVPAITGLSAQQVIADRRLARIVAAGMRETVRVGLAEHIHFARLGALSHLRLRAFALVPSAIGAALPRRMAQAMGATPNPGSTLQSIRRGQPSEIDYLSGVVVERGARNGVPTPVTAKLVELVHEVERTGAFIPPDEVARRIRA